VLDYRSASDWYTSLRSRRGDQVPEVGPDGAVRLQGEREWLFAGSPEEVARLVDALPGAERLSDTFALLSFGNAVGIFEVPGLGRLEIVSGKWDERHYDRMLADLTDVAVGLPFTSGEAAALPYDRSVASREDVLYHAFVYLRHIVLGSADRDRELLPALSLILRDPHRRFERTTRSVPVEQARRIDSRSLDRIVSSRAVTTVPAGMGTVLLARTLRGHLPERVEEPAVIATHDTPENRFVRAFLSFAQGITEGMRRVTEGKGGAFPVRVRRDCEEIEQRLRPILQHPLWEEVGPMIHVPVGSTVLQRRHGYREVFGHWVRLRLSTRIPLAPEKVRDLLEVKDIAELYELWCFFSLVREISSLIGKPAHAESPTTSPFQVGVPWDFQVRWPNGVRTIYNPRFSRSRSSRRSSYSIPLRPDIGLEIPFGPGEGLHLFDAKFKVDVSRQAFGADTEDETDDIADAERRGVFKRADLYKMHTYRDAIERARSVWILYPGTELSFFSVTGESASDAEALPRELDGVGAIPHLPDASDATLLRGVLARLTAPG
jgi:hypothetical protein